MLKYFRVYIKHLIFYWLLNVCEIWPSNFNLLSIVIPQSLTSFFPDHIFTYLATLAFIFITRYKEMTSSVIKWLISYTCSETNGWLIQSFFQALILMLITLQGSRKERYHRQDYKSLFHLKININRLNLY